MKDYRLYTYYNGTLKKWGYRKTGGAKIKHFYDNLEELEENIKTLIILYSNYNYQFLIVEYTGSYESKIIKIIE